MTDETRILYNADCPVCAFEIDRYAARARADGLPLRFEDLNRCETAAWGIDRDTAARRLHVLHDGKVHAGIDGFIVLWRRMPHLRWLARLVALPGVRHLAALLYDRAAAPLLYRAHLRRQARRTAAPRT